MSFAWKVIPGFGGGLAFDRHPAFLNDDEWSGCDGWFAKDGYAEVRTGYVAVKVPGGSWPPATTPFIVGIVQNPFSPRDAAVVGMAASSVLQPRLYTMRDDGTATEITFGTDSQGGATPPSGLSSAYLPAAFLDGYLCLSFGRVASGYSFIRWTGGATYQTIKPVGLSSLTTTHLASFGSHLVAAHGRNAAPFSGSVERMVYISDANSTDVWNPTVGNSADFFALDDAPSGITGVARLDGNALGIFTRDVTHSLSPTGSIPPFTRQYRSGRGCLDELYAGDNSSFHPVYVQRIGQTPVGVFMRGADDFYLNDTPVGRRIFRYYAKHVAGTTQPPVPEFKFHDTDGLVLIVVGRSDSTTAADLLLFDPATGAWARTALPDVNSAWRRHGFIYDNHAGANARATGRHWIAANDGTIYVENIDATVAHASATIDTKDFSFGSPPVSALIDRLKLDWEDLAGTAVLEVFAATRDDFGAGVTSSSGGDVTPTFVSVGTFVAGKSEMALRLRAKFTRFRIQLKSGGKARIRGLAIRYQVESDKVRSQSGYGAGTYGGGTYGGRD